jgi:hypothetical protein
MKRRKNRTNMIGRVHSLGYSCKWDVGCLVNATRVVGRIMALDTYGSDLGKHFIIGVARYETTEKYQSVPQYKSF